MPRRSSCRDALDQVELADRLGFDSVWEVEHHFLEEYSHSSASEVFLAAARSARRTSGSASGSSRCRPATSTPRAWPRRSRRSTSSPAAASSSGRGRRRCGAELGRLRRRPRDQARAVEPRRVDVATRMMVEEPFAGYDGRFVQMPIRNVVPKPKQKPHPPLWVACSRRETIRLAAEKGMGALLVLLRRARGGQAVGRRVPRDHRERDAASRSASRQPVVRGRGADDVPRRRGDGDRARHRRRPLLRLLARPLLRLRRAPPGPHEHLRGVRAAPRRGRLRARGDPARQGPARAEDHAGGAGLAARRDRHARPGPRAVPPLRGGRRRPDDLRLAGGAEQARAHLRVARAVRRRGAPGVRGSARTRRTPPGATGPQRRASAALARRDPPARGRPGLRARAAGLGPVAPPTASRAGRPRRDDAGPSALERSAPSSRSAARRRSPPSCAAPTTGRLERTIGSDAGLRMLFTGMARRFRPDKAGGFEGEILYELQARTARCAAGRSRSATAGRRPARRTARDPKLTLTSRRPTSSASSPARPRPRQALLTRQAAHSRATSRWRRSWARCSASRLPTERSDCIDEEPGRATRGFSGTVLPGGPIRPTIQDDGRNPQPALIPASTR